ncbi:MAG: tetratricopeptide repeat protein [Pseudomonadota bacterium]
MDNQPAKQTFFISRAAADSELARWLAAELRSEGHETILQDDDFGHQDFMAAMDKALSGPARVVALYSPAYFASEFCKAEGRHPLGRDPSNALQKLVPLLIEPTHVGGVFQNIAYSDLLPAREQGASVLRDTIWIALGLTPKDPAAAPAPLRKTGWVHREVYRDPNFVGREDLLLRVYQSLQGGNRAAVKALNGAGGIGKSTLAREYAARHAGDYAGVWWIRAETPETLASDLIELGGKFISGLAEAQDRDAAVQAALEAIEHLGGAKDWLLVYDNVPKPEDISLKTPRKGAKILITSRHASWQGAADEIDVDVFAPDVATDFLLERTGRADRDGAAEVAERLGYLPLALEQAASYLTNSTLSFTGEDSYLSHLETMIQRAPDGMEADRHVYGAVSLSLETANAMHPKAEPLFSLLAWMDPERIPVSLFQGAQMFERLELDEAFRALIATSLAKPTPLDDGAPALTVHRLSQDVMQARLKAAGEDESALEAAIALLAQAMAALNPQDVRNWPAVDTLDPHGQSVIAHADKRGVQTAALSTLLNESALLRKTRAQYAEAEPFYCRALEIDEAYYGPNHPTMATRLNNLAQLLQATNRLGDAEPLMARVVDISEKAYDGNHPQVAIALNNLAQLLHDTNRLGDAEPLMRRALEIDEASYGPDHPKVATRLNNLASLLQDTNRLGEAEPLMRRALKIDEASYGPDHPVVARDLNNLASLLQATSRPGEAEPLYLRALEIDEASYGPDHPKVAIRLNNLASLLQATNRLGDAEPLMRRALEIDKTSYGPDHPVVARDLINLASLLQDTNRLGEAEPLMRRALRIFRGSLPEGHPNIEVVAGNLAALEAEIAAAGGAASEPHAPQAQTPPPLDASAPSPAPFSEQTPRRGGPAMIVRQIVGAVLLAVGLWLGWQTLSAFLAYTGRGADAGAALADPVFLVPGIRSGLAIFGGLLALVRWPGAAPLAALATFLTALMGGLLALNGADSSMWMDDFIYAAILFLITCALLLRQRSG